MTSPALHVAHGTGLPVPLAVTTTTTIGRKSRESSAPPFLRRDPKELARLDAGPVVAPKVRTVTRKATPKPPKVKKERQPRKPRPSRAKPPRVFDEQAILDAYRSGRGLRLIAAEHHCHANRIKTILAAHGVPINPPHRSQKTAQVDRSTWREEYEAGAKVSDLGIKYDVHQHTIRRHLKSVGTTLRHDTHRITYDGTRHFTPAEQKAVIEAYEREGNVRRAGMAVGTGRLQARRILTENGVAIRPPGRSTK